MTTNWGNRRGQQIADYAMVIGTVATVFISSQMIISHRVAGVVAAAGNTILGTNLPLEETERPPLDVFSATCRPNHSCSQVQETGTSGFFRTVAHAESTGTMHSGFVMAETPGPHLGPMFGFARGEASGPAIAYQLLCGKGCEDLEFSGLTKDEEGWVTVAFRDATGEKKIKYRQKDFFRDVNGLWHADVEFLGEDGQVYEAEFLGAPAEEWQRLKDDMVALERAMNGIIVDQLSAQLGSLWKQMDEFEQGYNEKSADVGLFGDVMRFFMGEQGQGSLEGTLEELGDVTVADFLKRLDEHVAANEEGLEHENATIRVNLRNQGLSDEEAVAALSGYRAQEEFAREVVKTMTEALGVDPETTKVSALPGLLKGLSQEKFGELGGDLEPLLNDQQELGAAFEMVDRAKMVQESVGWDRYAGDQLFADNETPGDYREDQQTIQDQGNALLDFLRGPLREARTARETELKDSGIYSDEQIQQMLKEEYDQPAQEITGLVRGAFDEGGITLSTHHHGVPKYDEEGHYVGASWEPEPVRGTGHHLLGDAEAKPRALSAAKQLDAAYTEVVQEFVCQYDCTVSLGEGHELVDYDQLIAAALDSHAEQTGLSMVVDFGGGTKKTFDGKQVTTLPAIEDFTFISDDTRKLLEQDSPGGALRQALFGSEQKYQDFLSSLNTPPADTTQPIATFPTLDDLKKASSATNPLLQQYLRENPLTGPAGQAIDVAVGGEYDVLTDLVRSSGSGSAEQIIWRRADVLADEGGGVLGLISQAPQGRPVGITQREDQYITPVEMSLTGKVPHPSDVPEGVRVPGATYPEDTLLMRRNPDAVLPEGVGSSGPGSGLGTGGRTDPRTNPDWVQSIQ